MKRALRRLDQLQQRYPAIAVPLAVQKRFGEHGGGRLAAMISYWSFFSIFPLLLAFVTVLNVVLRNDPETRADLVDGALGQVPVIGTQLADTSQPLDGSWVTVSLGLLGALWSGLAAANALQVALDEIADVPRYVRPNPAVRRVRALAFMLILVVGIAVSTFAANATTFLTSTWSILVAGLVTTFVVDTLVLIVTFRLLTTGRSPWLELLPGALLGGLGFAALQVLGSWIIDRFIKGASDTYGTFAIVIALMSWFFLVSRLTLYGAELNGVLLHRLSPRSMFNGDDPTAADRRAAELDSRRVQTARESLIA